MLCAFTDRCVPLPGAIGSCFDGVRNGDEKGVDCGGSCSANCGASLIGSQSDGLTGVAAIRPGTIVGVVCAALLITVTIVAVALLRRHRSKRDKVRAPPPPKPRGPQASQALAKASNLAWSYMSAVAAYQSTTQFTHNACLFDSEFIMNSKSKSKSAIVLDVQNQIVDITTALKAGNLKASSFLGSSSRPRAGAGKREDPTGDLPVSPLAVLPPSTGGSRVQPRSKVTQWKLHKGQQKSNVRSMQVCRSCCH